MKIPKTRLPGRSTLIFAALAATMSLGHAAASPQDIDGDGIINRLDPDVDGDGILNGKDRNVDGGTCRKGLFKGKFVGDHLRNDASAEKDIDGDGLTDDSKSEKDIDGDGKGRARDDDDDGDGTDDSTDSDDDNDKLRDDDENEVELALSAAPDAPAGSRLRAKVKLSPNGKIELEFDGRDLAAGDYDVIVGGQLLGTLPMIADKKRTEGEVHFETNPNKADELPLPFVPFGLPVLIVAGDTTYFSGTIPTPSDVFTGGGDDNGNGQATISRLIKASGLSSEAEGSVEIQAGPKGVIGLEVEVEAIPAGSYDFIVDGTNRGTLSVILIKGKLKGKLRYEVVPDGGGELLLDFAVAGKSIVISQGATTFFSGTAPSI